MSADDMIEELVDVKDSLSRKKRQGVATRKSLVIDSLNEFTQASDELDVTANQARLAADNVREMNEDFDPEAKQGRDQ